MNSTDHYRLAALVELARRHPRQVPGAEIARRCNIPQAYFLRLVPDMVRQGLLRSRRGPGGGLCLAETPEQLTLERIITTNPTGEATTPAGHELARRLAARVQDELAALSLAEVAGWDSRHAPESDYVI